METNMVSLISMLSIPICTDSVTEIIKQLQIGKRMLATHVTVITTDVICRTKSSI